MTDPVVSAASRILILCRRAALAAQLALWCALLAALLGRYAWPLDLFAHFRLQYTVLFAVCAAALLALRRRALALGAVVGALVSSIPIVFYLEAPTARALSDATPFRLIAFNAWYRNGDYARIAKYLQEMQADAVVLEELSHEDAIELHSRLDSYPYSHIAPTRYGAVVLSRWPILAAQAIALTPGSARASHVVLDWRGTQVVLLGVHLHWPLGGSNSRRRNQALQGIASFAQAAHAPLLVAGDFNVTPWSAHFNDMLDRSGLSDCAAGHGLAPSWPAQLPLLGIRIDHCLASQHWRSLDVRTGPDLGSDHLPIVAELVLAGSP